MLPGSHLEGENPHHDTYGKDNILHRGQELDMAVDDIRQLALNFSQEKLLFTMAGLLTPLIPTDPMTDG